VFALCQKCALENEKTCSHNEKERSLTGTWVSLEIQKAVELGYKIIKIFEVWHWPQREQYDPLSKEGGLFTEYINMFLKGKQESSGFPDEAESDSEKQKYIEEYFEKEGIHLDIENISKNPAKRFVYKLALNSMWGRLGMNTSDRSTYRILKTPEEWFKMISDNQYTISSADFSNENAIQILFKKLLDEGSCETSVTHAAFVTAHARLKLYSELEKLGDRVLYFDTDSIIFVQRDNMYIAIIYRLNEFKRS
jgi:hypothetical protein